MTHAIETRELLLQFGSLVAVNRISFDVAGGSIFGLLGSNGAGKSTTIKMLTTLLRPSGGTATVAGFDIVKQPRDVRRHIGYVPQMLSADGALTGHENLKLSARLYGIPSAETPARIGEALELLELAESAHRLVKTYSGGMIRRLELAQAMLHRPAVLFLDEPTVGLDPVARHTVWEHLLKLRERYGMTILITTHDMEEADHLCDDIVILHKGTVAVQGKPRELKQQIGPDASLDDVFAEYSIGGEQAGQLTETAEVRRVARRLG
ncbi:MAG TPA: ATP-binding cassette domain-containing protein [Candidatus Acidoferrum sp.]|nr:ATP-binding cassette domain-containing protein [Candidatus Acidoferrum sp.]